MSKQRGVDECTMQQLSTNKHTYTLSGDNENFTSTITCTSLTEGVDLIHIQIQGVRKEVPPEFTLKWTHPIDDIQASWSPASDRNKSYKADWMRSLKSNAAVSAPVMSLFNINGDNRLTFAFSDALNTIQYLAGVHEESADFRCYVKLFTETTSPIDRYDAVLRVDTRSIPYYDSLNEVQQWWGAMPDYVPATVPEAARVPLYSTWYSMHQNMTAGEIEEQCALAKALGMDAVIVDDGWQTSDNRRGYAYCGDWEPYAGKFPDLAKHVEAIHRLGMKFILWYSVPFVGKHSRAWNQFSGKLLDYKERMGAGILDPRYPEVREHIITIYEQAVKAWDLDGFKLDFVDQFISAEANAGKRDPSHDYESVPTAVDRLLSDIITRLKRLKPDIMIEFRQPYIGPAMRKYGNMFRAGDCPNDSIQNRVRTVDIRLLAGDTAVHADMIMWNSHEPVESAALQMVNLLFSVPQISVLLDRLPERHLKMLRHWIGFWKQHRDVLLQGRIYPRNPELLYPVVEASNGQQAVIATYHDAMVSLPSQHNEIYVINGRLSTGIYVVADAALEEVEVTISDCCGEITSQYKAYFEEGTHELAIPPVGSACIHKIRKENSR